MASLYKYIYLTLHFFFFFKIIFIYLFIFYFTILYWFCHTSAWIRHGCTYAPHPEPPLTSLPVPSLWVIPVHQPQAFCILHQIWTGDSFLIWYYTCFNAILPNHPPTLFSIFLPFFPSSILSLISITDFIFQLYIHLDLFFKTSAVHCLFWSKSSTPKCMTLLFADLNTSF